MKKIFAIAFFIATPAFAETAAEAQANSKLVETWHTICEPLQTVGRAAKANPWRQGYEMCADVKTRYDALNAASAAKVQDDQNKLKDVLK